MQTDRNIHYKELTLLQTGIVVCQRFPLLLFSLCSGQKDVVLFQVPKGPMLETVRFGLGFVPDENRVDDERGLDTKHSVAVPMQA